MYEALPIEIMIAYLTWVEYFFWAMLGLFALFVIVEVFRDH